MGRRSSHPGPDPSEGIPGSSLDDGPWGPEAAPEPPEMGRDCWPALSSSPRFGCPSSNEDRPSDFLDGK
eukprot:239070-Pyramimonas_sp.AAC.1